MTDPISKNKMEDHQEDAQYWPLSSMYSCTHMLAHTWTHMEQEGKERRKKMRRKKEEAEEVGMMVNKGIGAWQGFYLESYRRNACQNKTRSKLEPTCPWRHGRLSIRLSHNGGWNWTEMEKCGNNIFFPHWDLFLSCLIMLFCSNPQVHPLLSPLTPMLSVGNIIIFELACLKGVP